MISGARTGHQGGKRREAAVRPRLPAHHHHHHLAHQSRRHLYRWARSVAAARGLRASPAAARPGAPGVPPPQRLPHRHAACTAAARRAEDLITPLQPRAIRSGEPSWGTHPRQQWRLVRDARDVHQVSSETHEMFIRFIRAIGVRHQGWAYQLRASRGAEAARQRRGRGNAAHPEPEAACHISQPHACELGEISAACTALGCIPLCSLDCASF